MEARSTADYLRAIQEAGDFVQGRLGPSKIALVLGSGLGPFTDYLTDQKVLDFSEIPHMPQTAVAGHKGKLILGTVSGKQILCLAGRTHAYEGYHMYQLTFMIRVMKHIGVELYITTNSSGGCQPGMTEGCIMATRDHINWFKRNPLYEVPELGEMHVDMRRVYSSRLLTVARRTAKAEHVQLFEGTAVTTSGPTYESFTEVKVGAKLGGSSFGMSLIPETMVAYSLGLEVFGCSMITNIAAGIDDSSMQLNHEDVIGVGSEFAPQFTKFMLAFISQVETKPPKSLVLPSDRVLPKFDVLPQRTADSPTAAQVREAAAHIVREAAGLVNLEQHRPEVAVYVSYGMEDLAEYLRSKDAIGGTLVRVPYSSIPHFPCITRSGQRGELCFSLAASGQNRAPIVFLNGNALESFNCEEAVFVALLLAHLGVEKLVHTFLAASNDPTIKADTVRIIGDAFDDTTVAPVAKIHNQPQYMSTALFNTNRSDLEDLSLAFRFAGQEESSSPTVHYAHFLGPSFPSRAEANLARECNVPLVGITSLALVFAARSVGMDVVGLAGVSYQMGDDPLADASYVLWRKMRSIIEALLRGNLFPKHRSERDAASRARTQMVLDGEPERRQQVSYHLAQPVTQGDPANVKVSADWLKAKGCPTEAVLAVVVDSRIPALPWTLTSEGSVSYADVPNFPAHAPGTVSWFTGPDKKSLLVLHGTVLFNEGRTNAEIGHSVRVLQALGVKRVVFVNEVASYSRQAPINSFVLLRDHFNRAGRNPLFGKNVPDFGIRFSDLGNLYTDTLRSAVRRCAQQADLVVTEVTAAFVVGPVFASLADAAVAKTCDADVACTGMIPEVIVARHANIPLAAIGIVKTCIVENEQFEYSTKIKSRNQRALVKLLEQLLERV